ncbi:SDR family NAD(P)-dependent oxidoreductase [Paenibacillus humicola]|uniref:SDR family NAD(P)-dependent oxidoreductase n=1 Tax=Paenibacillus humicola TaxID=3110540 RepID=UPI00237A5D9F|nr:glucose 1-dehydrogenase [Paenibacillus humicola]
MDYTKLFSLQGKTAVVTGGARGLGQAMAGAFASFGASVALIDMDVELARAAAGEIEREHGVRCAAFRGNVTDEADIGKVMNAVAEQFGSIDILLNNAGILKRGPAEEMSVQDWQAVMDVNLNGVFICSKEAAKHMIRQGGGSIVNIASMSGFIVNTPQLQAAYNTSKAAVVMATKSFASEWAPHGIRVNGIAPGYMKTSMTGPEFEPGGEYYPILQMIPMKRLGNPEELGGLAVFLASDASSYMTGETVVIDGGYTIW